MQVRVRHYEPHLGVLVQRTLRLHHQRRCPLDYPYHGTIPIVGRRADLITPPRLVAQQRHPRIIHRYRPPVRWITRRVEQRHHRRPAPARQTSVRHLIPVQHIPRRRQPHQRADPHIAWRTPTAIRITQHRHRKRRATRQAHHRRVPYAHARVAKPCKRRPVPRQESRNPVLHYLKQRATQPGVARQRDRREIRQPHLLDAPIRTPHIKPVGRRRVLR